MGDLEFLLAPDLAFAHRSQMNLDREHVGVSRHPGGTDGFGAL